MESLEMVTKNTDILHGNYTVKDGDTLMSIAARIGYITPAQLARFNHLGMLGTSNPQVFPGQHLYIPKKDELSAQSVRLRHLPGAATRVSESQPREEDTRSTKPKDGVLERLFVKVKAKRIILPSKREVEGLLIVTPDAVCFDADATAAAMDEAARRRRRRRRLPPDNDDPASDEVDATTHDVLALSVCIPVGAIHSFNTHADVANLLIDHQRPSPKTTTSSTTSRGLTVAVEADAPCPPPTSSPSSPPPQSEEEVCICIGVETERVLPCVAGSLESTALAGSDHTTLLEAACTARHVFKIPRDKITDIHDVLVSATSLAASSSFSSSRPENSDVSDTNGAGHKGDEKSPEHKDRPVSLIESALAALDTSTIEVDLLGGKSCILDEKMLKELSRGLEPIRLVSAMRLVYSSEKHGFSLDTLYRKTREVREVNLLLIRDHHDAVFGALLSDNMHPSQSFYGTGESCVFHWRNGVFKCYSWTKKNYYFMKGSPDSFLIGAKSGHSALWFDSNLKYGRSEATDTFDNPVLCTLPKGKTAASKAASNSLRDTSEPTSVPFLIAALEVWEVIS